MMEIMKKAASEMDEIKQGLDMRTGDIRGGIIKKYLEQPIPKIRLKSNLEKNEYLRGVKKTKEYIHDGDIYQVNFSQRFDSEVPIDPMDLYYILRKKNAAPFSAYLKYPEFSIGSSSPERFLYLKDDIIETRPIKGTRPRGKDEGRGCRKCQGTERKHKGQGGT